MRIAKWLGLGVAGLVLLLIVGAFVVLNLIDLDGFKPRITAAVEQATGRTLTMGEIRLRFTLQPALVIEDIAFANAEWSERPDMATVERVEARLFLLPLLIGRISLDEIVVHAPTLELETSAAGVGNWVFKPDAAEPEPEPTAGPPRPPPAVTFNAIRIERARVTYHDAASGRTDRIRLGHLVASMDDADRPINLFGATTLNGVGLALNGWVGNLGRLGDGAPYPVNLQLTGAGATVDVVGHIAKPLQGKGIDLAVKLEGETVADFGRLARAASHKPTTLPDVGPYSVAWQAKADGGVFAVRDIDIRIGESRLTGLLSADTTKTPIYVVADLTSPKVDLADVLPKPMPRGAVSGPGGPAPVSLPVASESVVRAAPVAATGPPRLIPDTRLPLGLLHAVNADIALEARSIVAKDAVVGDAVIRAVARNGILVLTRAEGHVAGGEAAASFILDARNPESASLHTGITVTGIEIGSVLKETGGGDTLSGAPIDVSIALASTGATPRDLVAHLNGDVLVQVGSGEIDNAYIDLIGADLLNAMIGFLNPFAASPSKAELRCVTAGLIVRDGRALIDRSIAVETGNTNVIVDGLVDLGTERLDLAVNTEARSGFTVSAGMLTRLMRLRGTLSNPSLGLDSGGVARTAASVAAAFATAGVSLVAESVISAVTRDRTPCETALVRAKAAMYGSG